MTHTFLASAYSFHAPYPVLPGMPKTPKYKDHGRSEPLSSFTSGNKKIIQVLSLDAGMTLYSWKSAKRK